MEGEGKGMIQKTEERRERERNGEKKLGWARAKWLN
jgi:hypothetical protein